MFTGLHFKTQIREHFSLWLLSLQNQPLNPPCSLYAPTVAMHTLTEGPWRLRVHMVHSRHLMFIEWNVYAGGSWVSEQGCYALLKKKKLTSFLSLSHTEEEIILGKHDKGEMKMNGEHRSWLFVPYPLSLLPWIYYVLELLNFNVYVTLFQNKLRFSMSGVEPKIPHF